LYKTQNPTTELNNGGIDKKLALSSGQLTKVTEGSREVLLVSHSELPQTNPASVVGEI